VYRPVWVVRCDLVTLERSVRLALELDWCVAPVAAFARKTVRLVYRVNMLSQDSDLDTLHIVLGVLSLLHIVRFAFSSKIFMSVLIIS
jgi:hypothetical protein